jgi:hypothetical protein
MSTNILKTLLYIAVAKRGLQIPPPLYDKSGNMHRVTRIRENPCLEWESVKIESKKKRDICVL